jgi:lipoprotein-releasing system permease protein
LNFPFYIARKYLIAKKSQQAINIISIIAMAGVTIGTMGLIVVLSVFNGLEEIVVSLFNSFDPDFKITLVEGKTFHLSSDKEAQIRKLKNVAFYTDVLEENALIKYRDKQYIATIKGVSKDFAQMTHVDSMMIEGRLMLEHDSTQYAVLGRVIADGLGLSLNDPFSPLSIYVPKRGKQISINPEDAFTNQYLAAAGIFAIQQDFDSKYVLTSIHFARSLLDYKNEVSSIEIGLKPNADMDVTQKQIQQVLGSGFEVKNRYQQNELLYKIMKSEKWAVYLILSFILLIATFNVIGSLTMLIIDKQKDISILSSMGADVGLIKKIFLFEGILISMIGAFLGLSLGWLICFLQQQFGLLSLGGTSFVMDSYPVKMQIMDFVYVFLTVAIIGLFAAWYPANKLVKQYFLSKSAL